MSNQVLIAEDITKSFGRFRVLNNLNLTLNKGDIYILFGSNGAGKTTLVKILSTVLLADSGELTIFGKKIKGKAKETKAMIGVMSHEPYLYNDLTAWENLNFFANLYSIKDKEGKIEGLLKEVGLYHRSHDRVGSFSRGMKQRLSLARSILHSPELIFLDEPYTGLDVKAQEILNNLLIKLNQKGKTFFLITHDIGKISDITNRSGILYKGKIAFEAEGEKQNELTDKYRDIIRGETF